MRWNVVIGGQEIAKTGKGLLVYHPTIFGREGILAAAAVLAAPFVLLSIAVRLFPPWPETTTPARKNDAWSFLDNEVAAQAQAPK
jgi:predicted membrane protein